MSPVGDVFVPSPPKTGTNLLHPLPPQSLNGSDHSFFVFVCWYCILLPADGPKRGRLPIPTTATLPYCMRPLKIFPSLPGSCLRVFIAMQAKHSYASSTNGLGLLAGVLTISASIEITTPH